MTKDAKIMLARSYDADALRRSQSGIAEWKLAERQSFIDQLLSEQKTRLLEIGAGTGKDAEAFSHQGLQVSCIDLSSEMVRFCKEKGLDARVMDFYDLDFQDGVFDAVYALNCLLHVPNREINDVLSEIRRVLKPNGLFYLGLYGGNDFEGIWEEDWCEPKRFFAFRSDDKIQALVQSYFHIEYFHKVETEGKNPHFQSLILRK